MDGTANGTENISASELYELAKLGVFSGIEVTKSLVERMLNVTLTEHSNFDRWNRTYLNVKSYRVIDPSTEGSENLVLCINFESRNFTEPTSFCFLNARNGWLVTSDDRTASDSDEDELPVLLVINQSRGYGKSFKPFDLLSRRIYVAEAYVQGKENS
jgi:hypothetical protein